MVSTYSPTVLLIVRRSAPDLFDALRRALDDSTICRVVLDRRVRSEPIAWQDRRLERQRWAAGVLVSVSGTDASESLWYALPHG
jgi:hypothetical protein